MAKRNNEKPSNDEQHAMLVAQMGGSAQVIAPVEHPSQPLEEVASPLLTRDELQQLLDAAQGEIEMLQGERKRDRETILASLEHRVDRVSDPLLSRDVAADEHDADPSESPGSAAYDAGLKAGLLAAALICETRWAGEIGSLAAASIREAEEKLQ